MANKNFIVKNGLEVGGQEVVSSSGVVTSAALGGQTLASTDSPTFNNLTLTNDIAVGGDINLTGDLNITGDVNTLSVTDLDVTDQTITLGKGQVESASGGSGIVIDGSGASILWDETNDEWDFNKKIKVTGDIVTSQTIYSTGAITSVSSITANSGGNTIVLSTDGAIEITRTAGGPYIDFKDTAAEDNDQRLQIVSGNFNFTASGLSIAGSEFIDSSRNINIGSSTISSGVITADGLTVDTSTLVVDATNNRVGIGTALPSSILHISGTNITGGIFVEDSSNSSASPVIKVQGKRSDANKSQSFSGGITLESLYTGGLAPDTKHAGTIYFGINHTDGTASNIAYSASISGILEGDANSASDMPTGLVFYTGNAGTALGTANTTFGTERMRIDASGNVGINQNSPQAKLDIKGDTTTYAGMSKIYLTDTSSNSERRNWAIGNGGSGYRHFSVGVSNAADGDPMASGTHTTPFVIDHEGRVSIGGYANPGNFYAGASQLVVGKGVGDQGITIYAGDGSIGRIHFADGTSGNAEYAGFIAYNHNTDVLQLGGGADGGTDIVLNNNAVGIGTSTTAPASGAKLEIKGTYASTAPATSGTTDSMTLRLSQTAGNGVLDSGWGDQGSNPHFWMQSRNSGDFSANYAIGLNPNGGNVFIGQKFHNKGVLTISEAGNTAGAAIDGIQLYKGLTNASNFLAWQQGNMGWRLGIRHNDGGYPLCLYMNNGSTPTAASPGDEILRFGTDQNMALNNTTTGWSAWSANGSTHLTVGNDGNSPTQCNYGVLNLLGAQASPTHFSIGVGAGTMYMAYDYKNGAHRLTVNSSGTFTGSASNDISDQRLKENIVTIPNALDKVKALKGRTFTWKASSKQAPGTKYGFIAQEVESVVSDLVYKDSGLCRIDSDDNPIHDLMSYEGDAEYAKSVQTSGVIPILVEAMKEQQTIIDDLKSRLETLEG